MPPSDSPPSSAADRQSALLSLLYPAASSLPKQIPTPPTSQPPDSNTSESQGKILLEQLMAG